MAFELGMLVAFAISRMFAGVSKVQGGPLPTEGVTATGRKHCPLCIISGNGASGAGTGKTKTKQMCLDYDDLTQMRQCR